MNIYEFLPIGSGLIAGTLLVVVPRSYRKIGGLFSILFLGLLSAVISGEIQISWAFLFIDVSLVASSTFVGFKSMNYVRSFQFGQPEAKDVI